MKFYINKEKNILLMDVNEFTPYLIEKGYEEITEQEYKEKRVELRKRLKEKYKNKEK